MAVRLGFIILAHERASELFEFVDTLTTGGSVVCVHYDAKASDQEFALLKEMCGGRADILFASREACGWGEYSLVQATLNGLKTLQEAEIELDYVCLLSGADLPIKPLNNLISFLEQEAPKRTEFMEFVPLDRARWVKGGLERERFVYRHYFNERRHPNLFQYCWRLQHSLGLKTKPPKGLRLVMGSQWWCLTWDTCCEVLKYIESHPEVVRYFRYTWIPDESFFQTIVGTFVPEERIRSHSLTFYQFTDYCKPYVFFDEHESFLLRQNFFFGRKVAHSASPLRQKLLAMGRSARTPVVDYERIGQHMGELDAWRIPHRLPLTHRRAIGRWQHASAQRDIPFIDAFLLVFVTPGGSPQSLLKRTKPASSDGWIGHGRLFHHARIDFAESCRIFGGYEDNDTAARDASPTSFLANIVGAGPAVTAFDASAAEAMKFVPDLGDCRNVFFLLADPQSLTELATTLPAPRNCSDVGHIISDDEDSVTRFRAEEVQSIALFDSLRAQRRKYLHLFTENQLHELLAVAERQDPSKILPLNRAAEHFLQHKGRASE